MKIPERVLIRIVQHFQPDRLDECWPYGESRDPGGYGRIRWNEDGRRRGVGAHRAAYEAMHGPISDGLTVDHLCFHPWCINPEHLRLMTRSANASNKFLLNGPVRCIRGHGFTIDNTYVKPNGTRRCRTCHALRQRAYRDRIEALTPAGCGRVLSEEFGVRCGEDDGAGKVYCEDCPR